MKLIHATPDELRLQLGPKELWRRSFIFELGLVPTDVTPRRVVIEKRQGKTLHEFKMSWRKFGKQTTIGDVVIIDKSEFAHFENGVKR